MDKRAVDELVTGSLDLVRIIARQVIRDIAGSNTMLDDFESAGHEGLVLAAQRFDPERGVPFRSFANYRIRGAMFDALRREANLPRRAYERLRALEAAADLNETKAEELTAPKAPGDLTTAEDRLADHLANLATAFATGMLARSVPQGDTYVGVDGGPLAEEQLVDEERRKELAAHVAHLPEQERALIERHYFGGERFDLVAKELGMSKSWASRLHSRAIGRLTKTIRQR